MKTWKICKHCPERFECENKKPCISLKKALQRSDEVRPIFMWKDEIEKMFPKKKKGKKGGK
jgi:hypothetical protein